MEILR